MKHAWLIALMFAATCHAQSVGLASWYSRQSCKREGTGGRAIVMANGRALDDNAMTCALWRTNSAGRVRRPTGESVKVTCLTTGRSLTVKWTDNGPGEKPRRDGVVIDLTSAAMLALAGPAGIKAGRIRVRLEDK